MYTYDADRNGKLSRYEMYEMGNQIINGEDSDRIIGSKLK